MGFTPCEIVVLVFFTLFFLLVALSGPLGDKEISQGQGEEEGKER